MSIEDRKRAIMHHPFTIVDAYIYGNQGVRGSVQITHDISIPFGFETNVLLTLALDNDGNLTVRPYGGAS